MTLFRIGKRALKGRKAKHFGLLQGPDVVLAVTTGGILRRCWFFTGERKGCGLYLHEVLDALERLQRLPSQLEVLKLRLDIVKAQSVTRPLHNHIYKPFALPRNSPFWHWNRTYKSEKFSFCWWGMGMGSFIWMYLWMNCLQKSLHFLFILPSNNVWYNGVYQCKATLCTGVTTVFLLKVGMKW